MHGGTFTITNPGQFGAVLATPIINQPQVAILDLEAIVKRPVVVEGPDGDVIAIRPMTYLPMSWDHRALDGAEAARFLPRQGAARGGRASDGGRKPPIARRRRAPARAIPPVAFDHEELVVRRGERSGLTIVAVHSTALGPALGGLRLWHYAATERRRARRLAPRRRDDVKAAAAGLDLGGGKGVICAPPAEG